MNRLIGVILICVISLLLVLWVIADQYQPNQALLPKTGTPDLTNNLRRHVWTLAEEIGERHFENTGSLQKTADYISEELKSIGLVPQYQKYDQDYQNIIAEIKGVSSPGEIILVGAHYDTVWLSPGADDNASGIAVMLELARILAPLQYDRTLRFVAFTNEEQPFSKTAYMGSYINAQQSNRNNEKIIGMFSLEMLGYYSDDPGSQHYPAPLNWFYPDRASFIAFVSNMTSGLLLARTLWIFRQNSDFDNQGLMVPEAWVPDIRRSDQAAFWDAGYAAVMVTDTANFRNNNYHTVGDLPGTLNYEKMAELTDGLARLFANLASLQE